MPDKIKKEKKELNTKTESKKSENTATKNKNTKKVQTNNRFTDVIKKMEEESKKVEKKKMSNERKSAAKENENNEPKKKNIKNDKLLIEKDLLLKEQKELEAVKEEIKNQITVPKEKMNKIYLSVFKNIVFAIMILMYFILINIGSITIKSNVFITDLKVFSIACIITTICTFEYAYKNDSGRYAINGIELLALSICTLLSIRIYIIYNNKFINIITSFALLFAIYYVGKAIAIYIKRRRNLKKQMSEINKIAKKRGN